ncbi:hypothetical protein [Sedimentisphaera salicampi]|nr:hypothetical protein [Sedimentisphaera salicampi]
MHGTLTGGNLGIPNPVGDAAGIATTVIKEAEDKFGGERKING